MPISSGIQSFNTSGSDILCIDKFIGDTECAALCQKLTANDGSHIKRLILRGNCLGVRGCTALSEMLEHDTSLEVLSLEWNQIGSSGAVIITETLQKNCTLKTLDFRNNGVTDEAIFKMRPCLLHNTSLLLLDLRWNRITDEGGVALRDMLSQKKNSKLKVLLHGNNISESILNEIEELYTAAPQLEPTSPRPVEVVDIDLQREYELLKMQVKSLTDDNADLRRQLQVAAMKLTDAEQQLLREEFQRKQLEENYRLAQLHLSELQAELKSCQQQWEHDQYALIEQHRNEMSEKNNELKSCHQKNDNLREALRKLQDSYQLLESQHEKTQAQFRSEISKLQETIQKLEESNLDLAVRESRAISEHRSMENALKRAEQKCSILARELEDMKRTYEDMLATARQQHDAAVEAGRVELNRRLEEARKLQQVTCDELARAKEEATALYNEKVSFSILLTKKCDEAAAEARQREKQLCQEFIDNLQENIEALTAAKKRSEQQHEEAIATLRQASMLSSRRIEELENNNSTLHDSHSRLMTQHRELQVVHDTLQSECKDHERNASNLSTKCQSLTVEVEQLRKSLADVNRTNESLRNQLQKQSEELAENERKRKQEINAMTSRVTEALGREFARLS